jgi:hypothetical protein
MRDPGRSISIVERNISMTAYPLGRSLSMVGRSVSIGACPWEHVLAGAYPQLEGAYPWEHIRHRKSWQGHIHSGKEHIHWSISITGAPGRSISMVGRIPQLSPAHMSCLSVRPKLLAHQ